MVKLTTTDWFENKVTALFLAGKRELSLGIHTQTVVSVMINLDRFRKVDVGIVSQVMNEQER